MKPTYLWGAALALLALLALPPGAAAERKGIDRVAIVVNTMMVTQREVEAVRRLKEQDYNARFKGEPLREKLAGLEKEVNEQVVENLLLEAKAAKLDIEVGDEELDQRVKTIREGDPRVAAIYSDRTLRELVMRDLLKQRVLNREVDSQIAVADFEVQQACERKRTDNREVDLGHILFRGPAPEALARAQQTRRQLVAGADFEQVALEKSEDPSVPRNRGRLGFNAPGNFLKAFEEVAFALKPGELSQPVRTRLGYHLIKVFAVRSKEQVDCQNLPQLESRQLRDLLWREKRQHRMKKFLDDLRADAEIRYPASQ